MTETTLRCEIDFPDGMTPLEKAKAALESRVAFEELARIAAVMAGEDEASAGVQDVGWDDDDEECVPLYRALVWAYELGAKKASPGHWTATPPTRAGWYFAVAPWSQDAAPWAVYVCKGPGGILGCECPGLADRAKLRTFEMWYSEPIRVPEMPEVEE